MSVIVSTRAVIVVGDKPSSYQFVGVLTPVLEWRMEIMK